MLLHKRALVVFAIGAMAGVAIAIFSRSIWVEPRPAGAIAAPDGNNLRRTVVVDVAERTKDAVVYISADKLVQQRVSPFGADPFWQQFDLPGMVQQRRAMSLGSGFFVHADGYIVTNNHVIDRALKIEVELLDGRKFQARLIASDPTADLAILKVDHDKPLPAIDLGDSSDLMIGEPVIAVGNPVGLSHSVSTGIVSAIHRDLRSEPDRDPEHPSALGDLIQTDAAINPGNSGGPLLNAYGQVIGINAAIRSDAQNIGFAIEVNRLRDLIPELMNPAQVTKVDMPLKFKESRSLVPPAQVTTSLTTDTGRSVISIAGQKPRDIVDAYAILLRQKPDAKLDVVYSDGKEPLVPKAAPRFDAIAESERRLGLVVEALNGELAQKYGLPVDSGILIREVKRDSVATRAKLRAGDVLMQLDRYTIASLEDYSVLLQHLPKQGKIKIRILRPIPGGYQVGFGMLEL